jgi:hypothetical protein
MLDLAIEDLVAALTAAGFAVDRAGKRSIKAAFDDTRFQVDVVPTAYATAARVDELVNESPTRGRVTMLVADRITADGRERLSEAGWGWFDRRGHIHLRVPGVLIDSRSRPRPRPQTTTDKPIRGLAGRAIGYRLLTRNRSEPISPTRSSMTFAPSTISEALSRLRSGGLVDAVGLPVIPELFWALADDWTPERVWLANAPSITEAAWHDPAASGWCVSGTAAAIDWGAPVVSLSIAPDFYVPGPVAVTIAARRHGVAFDAYSAAASIAVAPVGDVTAFREEPRNQPWPLAHPVAVALDLAQDRARGREILDDWSPTERVW